ncbi:Pentatricopeptide repeat-containing protein [Capsicum chinense]|nr:Pentatricopeptide repeat-containing protein [Capsicum chinense]
MGFDSNLVALNSFINGLCKAGHLDHALRMFESMDVKDSITYSTMVHSLCKARRFRAASKLLLSCIRGGMRILKSDKRGVIDGLRSSGYSQEARKHAILGSESEIIKLSCLAADKSKVRIVLSFFPE